MIHVVFERRAERMAVFGPEGRLWHTLAATGDTLIPAGHYRLLGHSEHEAPTPDDGPGMIYVGDLDEAALRTLVDAGRARMRAGNVEIVRLLGAVGGLARYRRSGVAIRGGGPSLARLIPPEDPLAPYQRLTRGDGGVRVHNADLARLMLILGPVFATDTVVLTVLGEPAPRGV